MLGASPEAVCVKMWHDSLLRQSSALLLHIKLGHPQSPQHLQTAGVSAVGGQRQLHLQQSLHQRGDRLWLKGFHNVIAYALERERHWPWAQRLWQRSTGTVKPPAERQSQAVRRAHIPPPLQRWHRAPSDSLRPAPTTHTHTHRHYLCSNSVSVGALSWMWVSTWRRGVDVPITLVKSCSILTLGSSSGPFWTNRTRQL